MTMADMIERVFDPDLNIMTPYQDGDLETLYYITQFYIVI